MPETVTVDASELTAADPPIAPPPGFAWRFEVPAAFAALFGADPVTVSDKPLPAATIKSAAEAGRLEQLPITEGLIAEPAKRVRRIKR